MQKSTKRLLSMLAVLALVLTMAPAGILAVETKADEIQSNLPAGIAEKKAAAAAIQAAAATARENGTCPACNKPVEWVALPGGATSTRPASTVTEVHYYIPDGYTSTAANLFLSNDMPAGATACFLLEGDATVGGRFLFYSDRGITVNFMGTGSIHTTNTNSASGLLSLTSAAAGSNSVMNLYGGQYSGEGAALTGATLYNSNKLATINIWNDTIIGGDEVPTATSAAHFATNIAGTLNLYDGTIQNGKYNSALTSGEYPTYKAGNLQLAGTAKFNMYGGVVKNGYGSRGGNMYINKGTVVNVYAGEIKDGYAVYHGGNIFSNGGNAVVYLNGAITGGKTAGQGGNIYVLNSGTIELGNVDIYGGMADPGASLSNNIRLSTATLKLSGNANASGILMTAADSLVVTPDFTGDVYLWNTAGVTLGGAVVNSSATGAFTGIVRNGAWQPAAGIYVPVAMQWDGATGLKYAAQGVVYNGVLTPAASGQAAVDAYVAAMADEEVEEKPQYVYVTEDVQLKDGAEVAIWAGADITVSGKGVVQGVDRTNDNYEEHGTAITVSGDVTVAKEVTAGGRHYIALADGNKYTFHRVEAVLTSVTVNKDNAGMYYKAEYKFDAEVAEQVKSYGVLVKLNEAVTSENYANKTASEDMTAYDTETKTLTAKSHGVYGIFKTTNEAAVNVENGKTKLFGNPYLVIGDEMFTAAESTGMSLADAMERANTVWEQLSEENQNALKAFVNDWKALGAWETELLEKLTNFA